MERLVQLENLSLHEYLVNQLLLAQDRLLYRLFISIGSFDTEEEARNASKYLKTKFARTLFGILKVTQDVTPAKWAYVPIQDFTNKSDIPWESSVSEIDEKLYKKYKLSDEEVAFIESHVADIE